MLSHAQAHSHHPPPTRKSVRFLCQICRGSVFIEGVLIGNNMGLGKRGLVVEVLRDHLGAEQEKDI